MCDNFTARWRQLPDEIRRTILQNYCPAHNATAIQLKAATARLNDPHCPDDASTESSSSSSSPIIAVSTNPLWEPSVTGRCLVCRVDLEAVDCLISLQWSSNLFVWACLGCLRSRLYFRAHDDDIYYRTPRRTDVPVWARLPPPWSPEILQVASYREILGASVTTFIAPGFRS